ncbi:Cell cycle checkpoint control protein RAD9A [Rhynchospora pubera]|uniref:Cell cycle checkpoint control protein RAD9A n=1 Tax=Rhynchospora pubera TaxID=906938 RepID=A0AAV8FPW0_9POAL|nr:Cell cycle checkpoint control protein RAD9A [Rhynchospora pubera]
MELSMSGNALKTFNRCITCLARVGSELVFQASPSKLELHTLNASRSAYQSISFTPAFFDTYTVSSSPGSSDSSPDPLQCSVLLKAVLSVLRTPAASVDSLAVTLLSAEAAKIQFSLHCLHGLKKTYWITCNSEPEIQRLSLDRSNFPSSLVVRPKDLSRLLSNFQSSLHEITIIATEPANGPSDVIGDIGGKAVELRSYIDPAEDNNDAKLHTQLWIDPVEEFLQYSHRGNPVDVTFGVKEIKAFLAFCEGCEVDIHLFFEKAGEPVLLAPRFGLDDGSSSDFDANLVLATMLVSQLVEGINRDQHSLPTDGAARARQKEPGEPSHTPTGAENASAHTKIWSDLTGTAARNSQNSRENVVQQEQQRNPINSAQDVAQDLNVNAQCKTAGLQNTDNLPQRMETDQAAEPQEFGGNHHSQHHPSNWVGPEDDDGDEDDEELFVQSTPDYN